MNSLLLDVTLTKYVALDFQHHDVHVISVTLAASNEELSLDKQFVQEIAFQFLKAGKTTHFVCAPK